MRRRLPLFGTPRPLRRAALGQTPTPLDKTPPPIFGGGGERLRGEKGGLLGGGAGGGGGLADDDGLDVGELADAEAAELAAVAAAFDAAEGEAGVGGDHAVDEDVAGFDATGELGAALDVGGPQRGAQAVGGVVGQLDGVVGVARANHRRHWAEDLLAEGGHLQLHSVEYSRRVVVAFAVEWAATDDGVRAAGDGLLHLLDKSFAQVASRQWSDVRLTLHRVDRK